MKRREFITLGSAAAVWPGIVRAQQPRMPVIGFLGSETPAVWADRVGSFRQGLKEAGYEEGRNVAIEYRWAEGHYDRLPALAVDLVNQQVSVLVVLGGTPSAVAAKGSTTTIPIVFRTAADPVEAGLVASMSRPGGNVTGVTSMGVELGSKQLELLHELAPAATVIALLINPTNPVIARAQARNVPAAGQRLGLQFHMLNASEESDFDTVFAKMNELRVRGLIIAADTFLNAKSERLAALAVRHAIPTVSPYREFTAAGGLMSYGASVTGASRQAATYVGRIEGRESWRSANPATHTVSACYQWTSLEIYFSDQTRTRDESLRLK